MSTERSAPRHPAITRSASGLPTVTVGRIAGVLVAYLGLGYEVRQAADGWVLLSGNGTSFVLIEDTQAPSQHDEPHHARAVR